FRAVALSTKRNPMQQPRKNGAVEKSRSVESTTRSPEGLNGLRKVESTHFVRACRVERVERPLGLNPSTRPSTHRGHLGFNPLVSKAIPSDRLDHEGTQADGLDRGSSSALAHAALATDSAQFVHGPDLCWITLATCTDRR